MPIQQFATLPVTEIVDVINTDKTNFAGQLEKIETGKKENGKKPRGTETSGGIIKPQIEETAIVQCFSESCPGFTQLMELAKYPQVIKNENGQNYIMPKLLACLIVHDQGNTPDYKSNLLFINRQLAHWLTFNPNASILQLIPNHQAPLIREVDAVRFLVYLEKKGASDNRMEYHLRSTAFTQDEITLLTQRYGNGKMRYRGSKSNGND